MKKTLNIFINIILLFFSIVITLIICEVVIRIFFPLQMTKLPVKYYSDNGISYKPHSEWTSQGSEFIEKVKINLLGYRDAEIDKKKETIVFIGDSQTFGTGVNFGERYTDIIRQEIINKCGPEKYNVLNISKVGANTSDEFKMLRDILQKGVKIKHIFIGVVANDHMANFLALKEEQSNNRIKSSEKHSLIQKIIKTGRHIRYSSHLFVFVMDRLQGFEWFRKFYIKFKYYTGFAEIFEFGDVYYDSDKIREWTAATKHYLQEFKKYAGVSVITLCDRYRYNDSLKSKVQDNLVKRGYKKEKINFNLESILLEKISKELKIDYIDPISYFLNQSNPENLTYVINGHYTPKGHRLVAEYIWKNSLFLQDLLKVCKL